MIIEGGVAALRRDGDHVIKVLDGRHPAGAGFVMAAQGVGVAGMNAYLSTLRAAGVGLPPDLSVVSARPLAVRHRWVSGPVLLDHVNADPARFVEAVAEIARWVRALDGTDARVDTNLANFCLDPGVVLVDVLPPLVPSVRPDPSNLFDVLSTALRFDTAVTLDALIGYAARAFPRRGTDVAAAVRDVLAHHVAPGAVGPGGAAFPVSWFRARVVLALRALAGDVEARSVHEFFDLTSVRAFRDLSEPDRAHRVRRVSQAIEKLGAA